MAKKKPNVEKENLPSYEVAVRLCKIALYADKIAGSKEPEQSHKDIIQNLFSNKELCNYVNTVLKEENIK